MRAVILVAAIMQWGFVSSASHASDLKQNTMCWTPEQLRGKTGEIAPRAGVRGARVKPPQRTLTAFTPIPSHLQGAIRRVKMPEGKKLIALTFDLCEAAYEIAGYDGRIVDYLRANDVKATFFAGGKWLLTHPERTQQLIADPLFEIANHGWRHANFRSISGPARRNEIDFAQAAYEEMRAKTEERQCLSPDSENAAQRMALIRFPYGTCNPAALKAASDAGLLAVQWDLATGDPDRRQSARAIAARVKRTVRPGSIILGHANGRGWNMAAALPLFVPALKEMGYEFVTVSELLASGEPEIVSRCYDRAAGDTERWIAALSRARRSRRSANKRNSVGWDPFRKK